MDTFNALTPGSATIILLGVTFLGGAVGSFLNVVIYRLPAGLSLVHPPSRCPRCEHPIRAYDNIPVLGWILLGGKCRDCGQPISPRYPTIEAIVAITFLLIAWLEWFGPRYGLVFPGFISSVGALVARAGLHLLLLTSLLGAGMIEWDGARVPKRVWLPVIVAGITCWAFFPSLTMWPAWDCEWITMNRLIDGLSGAVAGAAFGRAFWLMGTCLASEPCRTGSSAKQKGQDTLVWSMLNIGLVLGWQAAFGVALIYLPILLIDAVLQRKGVVKKPLSHGLYLFLLTLGSLLMFSYLG